METRRNNNLGFCYPFIIYGMGIAKKFLNNNDNDNDNSNFKSQFILAEHECSTNWGDCKANKSNQIIK